MKRLKKEKQEEKYQDSSIDYKKKLINNLIYRSNSFKNLSFIFNLKNYLIKFKFFPKFIFVQF